MRYEVVRTIKESRKGLIQLVRNAEGEQLFVRKILEGQHLVYLTLQNCPHPYLPGLYEVEVSGNCTVIVEEYIEGQSLGSTALSERQLYDVIRELCSVLKFLHEKGIIHRDIKPSNIMLAKDGHIRLIDFDAARILKDDLEQDTRLLGTRGYAPPEQYGFAQTDARTDIYALGITIRQLAGENAQKSFYRKIIRKCTNLNPDKRYQTARQVGIAVSFRKYAGLCGGISALLLLLLCLGIAPQLRAQSERPQAQTGADPDGGADADALTILAAPDNPHWDNETGIAVWGNVPESGNGDGEVSYHWRLYRRDTDTPPGPEEAWDLEGSMRGNGSIDEEESTYCLILSQEFWDNGFYYFAVSADGDQVHYADSPYVISDSFEYTGESVQQLPAPAGLQWRMYETDDGRVYYATWSNLDDYEDTDSFNVTVYDKDGNYVMNNIWDKTTVMEYGYGGIRVRPEFLTELGGKYRFTVEVYSSRPNEYRSYLMPDPIPEEFFSPWYNR